jgi:hypothetical protein
MPKVVKFVTANLLAFGTLFFANPVQAQEIWWAQESNEHETITLTAPEGWQFVYARAWYGDPFDWNCGQDVSQVLQDLMYGQTTVTVTLDNSTFGDPCGGVPKVTRFTWGIVPLPYEPIVQPSPEPTPESTPEPSPAPTPEPAPSPEPSPSPTPETTQAPAPAPAPEPQPAPEPAPPIEEPVVPIPEATPDTPAPAPTPTQEPQPTPEPVVVPTPTPEPSTPVVEPLSQAEQISVLAEAARADDPQVSEELAAIPLLGNAAVAVLEAFNALGNVGSDMLPEERKEAQQVVVSSVIVGQIATTASVAMSGASYRRIK